MSVLCVASPGFDPRPLARALQQAGIPVETARDAEAALWNIAGRAFSSIVLELSGDSCWELVEAALWQRPPARVIALAAEPIQPAMRRRAYQAGVWELAALPPKSRPSASSLVGSVQLAIARRRNGAVLLVDDSPDVREGIGGLIAEEGYRVETAASAAEAARLLRSRDYAVVITEVRKAGPDGFQVIREAARWRPGIPVVVLTAALDDAAFFRSVELGAAACVWKLSDPEEILRQIEATMAEGPQRARRS